MILQYLSISASAVTTCILVLSFWRDRSLIVKPSFFFLIAFNVMIQWAAALDLRHLAEFLPNLLDFFLLTQVFPLICLAISLSTKRRLARQMWVRLQNPREVPRLFKLEVGWSLAALILICTGYYFYIVPFSKTGLYAVLYDPSMADIARANSLSTVSNPLLGYSFAVLTGALVPLFAVLLTMRLVNSIKEVKFLNAALSVAALFLLFVVVNVTGARSYSALLMITLLIAFFIKRGAQISPISISVAIILVLVVPAYITLIREGKVPNLELLGTYVQLMFEGRVMRGPMVTGSWYVHYAQTHGTLGLGAIPKLAAFLGVHDIINPQNLIGLTYEARSSWYVNSNASFVFTYYSYFGLFAYPICIFGIWVLDYMLVAYQRMSSYMLLPAVASVSVATMSFAGTEYTVVLITNCFLIIPLLVLLLEKVFPPSPARTGLNRPVGTSRFFRPKTRLSN